MAPMVEMKKFSTCIHREEFDTLAGIFPPLTESKTFKLMGIFINTAVHMQPCDWCANNFAWVNGDPVLRMCMVSSLFGECQLE